MAFSGLHVVCAYAGSLSRQRDPVAILGSLLWSERVAVNGTTTKAAPGNTKNGDAVFHVTAAADGYVAVGPDPSAAGTLEVLVRASDGPMSFYVKAGDKLKWTAA